MSAPSVGRNVSCTTEIVILRSELLLTRIPKSGRRRSAWSWTRIEAPTTPTEPDADATPRTAAARPLRAAGTTRRRHEQARAMADIMDLDLTSSTTPVVQPLSVELAVAGTVAVIEATAEVSVAADGQDAPIMLEASAVMLSPQLATATATAAASGERRRRRRRRAARRRAVAGAQAARRAAAGRVAEHPVRRRQGGQGALGGRGLHGPGAWGQLPRGVEGHDAAVHVVRDQGRRQPARRGLPRGHPAAPRGREPARCAARAGGGAACRPPHHEAGAGSALTVRVR